MSTALINPLLTTNWSQSGDGINTYEFNKFSPSIDGQHRPLAGCVPLAYAQTIYYWIKQGYDLTLSVTESDFAYLCDCSQSENTEWIKIDASNMKEYCGVSLDELNSILSEITIDADDNWDSDYDIAALNLYVGLVLHTVYHTDSTYGSGTISGLGSNEGEMLRRLGFKSASSFNCTCLPGTVESMIDSLSRGEVILWGLWNPAHVAVIDGYNPDTQRFHVNMGWGGSGDIWITADEICNTYSSDTLITNLSTELVTEFTVTTDSAYDIGSLFQAIARTSASLDDTVSFTIRFASSMEGKDIKREGYGMQYTIASDIFFENFNVNLNLRAQSGDLLEFYHDAVFGDFSGSITRAYDPDATCAWPDYEILSTREKLTIQNMSGLLIANTKASRAVACISTESETWMSESYSGQFDISMNGGGIFAGNYLGGHANQAGALADIGRMLEDFSAGNGEIASALVAGATGAAFLCEGSGDDTLKLDNRSVILGDIEFSKGNDTLVLQNGSLVVGDVIFYESADTVTVDSSSQLSGRIYGNGTVDVNISVNSAAKDRKIIGNISAGAVNSLSVTVDAEMVYGNYRLFSITDNSAYALVKESHYMYHSADGGKFCYDTENRKAYRLSDFNGTLDTSEYKDMVLYVENGGTRSKLIFQNMTDADNSWYMSTAAPALFTDEITGEAYIFYFTAFSPEVRGYFYRAEELTGASFEFDTTTEELYYFGNNTAVNNDKAYDNVKIALNWNSGEETELSLANPEVTHEGRSYRLEADNGELCLKTFAETDCIPGHFSYQVKNGTVYLDWEDALFDSGKSTAVSYRFRYGATSVLSDAGVEVKASEHSLAGLTQGVWYYQVSAVDSSGNVSDWSAVQSFELKPEPAKAANSSSDINGDGISDVMFQYTGGNYQLGFWMDGTNTWKSQNKSEPVEWEVLGTYDMDSSGKADAVLVGNVTVNGIKGAFIGYYKDADTGVWENISYLTNADSIVWKNKVGNLTGNEGKNSIVWHAPELGALGVWTDGTDNWVSLGGGYDSSWVMSGTGDFNGDGKDEVLFSHGGTFYSTDIDGKFNTLGTAGSGWEVRTAGDFTNDGKDDIVIFHKETGVVARLDNGVEWNTLGQLDANDWFVVGAGEYNGTGAEDLLVRQYSTGMLGYYADGDLNKWIELGRGVDMDWTVIA